jgi:FtsH-binding integral membrane protein
VWFTKPYIFLILQWDYRKIMVKMLEMLGLVLVAIMTLGFVGVFEPNIRSGTSYLFWGCAGAALMIIIYRKMKRKKEEKES